MCYCKLLEQIGLSIFKTVLHHVVGSSCMETPHTSHFTVASTLQQHLRVAHLSTVMARLSGVRPSTESEEEEAGEQSVSAEGVSDSEEEEEGAMVENTPPKRRRLNPDTRHANGNASRSSQQRAMGQEESRETVRGRNAALHSAGQEARQPKGKLKSLGGPLSARRIPLANGNTYDVLDDNEEAVLSNNVRRTPIRRTTKPAQSARKSPDPDQAFIDQQLGIPIDVEEEDAEHDAEQDEEDAESEHHVQEEIVVEQPQQSSSVKRKPGRPPKAPKPTHTNGKPVREPGWLLKQSHQDNRRRTMSIQPSTSAVQSPEVNAAHADPVTPSTTAAPTRKRGRPTNAEVAARAARASSIALAQQFSNSHAQTNVRSARVSGEDIQPTIEQAATSNRPRGIHARARTNNHSSERQRSTEATNSAAQPVVIDDEQYDDRAHDTNEEAEEDDVDHGPQGNDEPEENDQPEENGEPGANDEPEENYEPEENDEPESDEAEEQPEPPNLDSPRLHGQWGYMRGILREAVRHNGETPDITDNTFNATLRACKDVKKTVRAIPSDIGPDELEQITSECRSSVSRAKALCRDTSEVRNRDERGYHIYKFLMPTLAKLVKSVVEAFERVDIDGAGLQQISMAHLFVVTNLVYAIYTCGNAAYHAYIQLPPDRPVKRDVHTRITIALRDLHAALRQVYRRRVTSETASLEAAAMTEDIETRIEEHEQQQEWRNKKMRNQAKWKKMDTVRRDLIRNSSDEIVRLHMAMCPSKIVETHEDGQPFIPVEWRKKVTTFTMRELEALQEGLQKHVDTPDPLTSEVFENLMLEYCRFGGPLSKRNTLEIVRQAGDMRAAYIKIRGDNGAEPPRWVWRVPVWMEPMRY